MTFSINQMIHRMWSQFQWNAIYFRCDERVNQPKNNNSYFIGKQCNLFGAQYWLLMTHTMEMLICAKFAARLIHPTFSDMWNLHILTIKSTHGQCVCYRKKKRGQFKSKFVQAHKNTENIDELLQTEQKIYVIWAIICAKHLIYWRHNPKMST